MPFSPNCPERGPIDAMRNLGNRMHDRTTHKDIVGTPQDPQVVGADLVTFADRQQAAVEAALCNQACEGPDETGACPYRAIVQEALAQLTRETLLVEPITT